MRRNKHRYVRLDVYEWALIYFKMLLWFIVAFFSISTIISLAVHITVAPGAVIYITHTIAILISLLVFSLSGYIALRQYRIDRASVLFLNPDTSKLWATENSYLIFEHSRLTINGKFDRDIKYIAGIKSELIRICNQYVKDKNVVRGKINIRNVCDDKVAQYSHVWAFKNKEDYITVKMQL